LVYAFKIVRSQTKKTCNIKAGIENVGIWTGRIFVGGGEIYATGSRVKYVAFSFWSNLAYRAIFLNYVRAFRRFLSM
jgi:hypothetical protein